MVVGGGREGGMSADERRNGPVRSQAEGNRVGGVGAVATRMFLYLYILFPSLTQYAR